MCKNCSSSNNYHKKSHNSATDSIIDGIVASEIVQDNVFTQQDNADVILFCVNINNKYHKCYKQGDESQYVILPKDLDFVQDQ